MVKKTPRQEVVGGYIFVKNTNAYTLPAIELICIVENDNNLITVNCGTIKTP